MELGLEVLPVRRRGRPCRYNSAYCDRVLILAAEGCGKAEIAAGLGVSVKTLNAWMTAFDDFRQAMSEAKELEYAWWLRVGRTTNSRGRGMRAPGRSRCAIASASASTIAAPRRTRHRRRA